MHKISEIVQDCIRGCWAVNADEKKMHFNINYYVNSAFGSGEKYYLFVYKVEDLEDALFNIIRNNVTAENDVVISDITIKHMDEIISVNKHSYPYGINSYIKNEFLKKIK